MCGIVGIASQTIVTFSDWLVVGRDAMSHRGPDDVGEWWSEDGRVGLAHRRLSINDLSPAGHQPMLDSTKMFTIVFNGEIYNFKELRNELSTKGEVFFSHSDTEVILAAYREWGVDCLSRLNGMFSFAIYDTRKQIIFIARDRAGEKPLFYHHANGALRFASELKAILADQTLPRHIDAESLDCYLAMGYVPGERCILQGFHKLPPAHALQFDLRSGEARVWKYWKLPEQKTGITQKEVEEPVLLDELETLLEDAVRHQLVADVPVGVLLSGGVDSSLITAMAVRASSQIKTFTIRFPGYGQYDETEHARLISRYFSTDHMELDAGASSVDLLPLLASQLDEPMADSSLIPTYLVSQLVREHCTVALGGDGGDELFGGYKHYNNLLWMQQKLGRIPRSLRTSISKAAKLLLPVGFKGRNFLQSLGCDMQAGLPLISSYFDFFSRQKLMSKQGDWKLLAEGIREKRIPQKVDLLQRAIRMDYENYLPEDILVKVDRSSMLSSLEVRSPLLDYRLIEFAFGKVPSHLKATQTRSKVLLKKLTTRILPPEFDQHRKQGFSIPLAYWLRSGSWQMFFQEVLLDSGDTIFNRKYMADLIEGQKCGRSNSERLFALVLFELWRKEYRAVF